MGRSKKFSVVCAPQTFGCNTGMFSVDLAAWYFLHKNFPDADIRFLTIYPHKCEFGNIPYQYESQEENLQRLRTSDVILYWGDFLHNQFYQQAVARQLLAQGICSSSEQAMEEVRKFLFLAGFEQKVLAKTVLYGGTLLFNQADSFGDVLYVADLKRMIRSARRVWVREPFSAFLVNLIQGKEQYCVHGTDAAQLLRNDFVDHCSIKGHQAGAMVRRKKLGIFLGRSQVSVNNIAMLLAGIESGLQVDLVWLNWGEPPFFLDRKSEFMQCLPTVEEIIPSGNSTSPPVTLAALLELDFLVTDTYHCAVNAWNFGIPAICLIDNSEPPLAVNSGSEMAGRDKRVAFYWTYNAAAFLLYSSDLEREARIPRMAAEIVSLLNNQIVIQHIRGQMLQHVELSEGMLLQSLRGLLK